MVIESRKKRIFIIITSVTCALAILFSVFWFVPYLRFHVLRMPEWTKALFPKPDAIVIHCNDLEVRLTEAECEELYGHYVKAMENIESCTFIAPSGSRSVTSSFYWEFQYDHRYKYVGTLGTEDSWDKKSFAYDSLVMRIDLSVPKLVVLPMLNRNDVDIDAAILTFSSHSAFYAIRSQVLAYVIDRVLCASEDADDDTVIESTVFPTKPDSAIACRDGKALELTDEQMEKIYDMFMAMTKDATTNHLRIDYHPYDLKEKVEDIQEAGTAIGFRYHKGQQHRSEIVDATVSSQGQIPVSAYYDGQKYEGFYFWLSEIPNTEILYLQVIVCRNGTYTNLRSWNEQDAGIAEELKQYIDTIFR